MATPRQALGPRDALGSALLHLHLRGGEASRSELTAAVGCGRSVMGYLLHELTDLGLITVSRRAARAPAAETGRPSHQVTIADAAPVVIAVELGVDLVRVATVGFGGHLLSVSDEPMQRSDTPAEVLDRVAKRVTSSGGRRILAVGLAVPSPVRHSDGVAVAPLHLGWPALPLGELLRQRMSLPLPVVIGNDANLAALAEHRHGAGRGSTQMLYLTTARVGLGGSLISAGQIFGGAHGLAIEPGHITVDPTGAACTCGSTGCLEVEADHRGLLRAAAAGEVTADNIPAAVETVLSNARRAQPSALAAVRQLNTHLGNGLASLVNITDPDRIVLGGTLAQLYQLAPGLVTDQIAQRSFLSHDSHVPVQPGELSDSALLGAAEVAVQRFLDNPRLLRAG